jgi:hypothetical protein
MARYSSPQSGEDCGAFLPQHSSHTPGSTASVCARPTLQSVYSLRVEPARLAAGLRSLPDAEGERFSLSNCKRSSSPTVPTAVGLFILAEETGAKALTAWRPPPRAACRAVGFEGTHSRLRYRPTQGGVAAAVPLPGGHLRSAIAGFSAHAALNCTLWLSTMGRRVACSLHHPLDCRAPDRQRSPALS